MRHPGALAALASSVLVRFAAAQGNPTILGSIVYVRTGDRTPYVYETSQVMQLTPLGAHQLYDVGSFFRERYILSSGSSSSGGSGSSSGGGSFNGGGSSTAIYGLSPDILDPGQVSVASQDNAFSAASAQAFFQSFYPPAGSGATTYLNGYQQDAFLASNSSTITTPLGGYQLPWIQTASPNDANSIFTDGYSNCLAWMQRESAYQLSSAFKAASSASQSFYSKVGAALSNAALPSESYAYMYAFSVYDYVAFMNQHNTSFYNTLSTGSLANTNALGQLQALSDEYSWATFSSNDNGATAGAVAGQTLAGKVLDALSTNVDTTGLSSTLNLVFGEFAPITALASLLGLENQDPNFRGLPLPGSSLVFELFVDSPETVNFTTNYPNSAELQVRLLFRNGTVGPLRTYTLFPSTNSKGATAASISWGEFMTAMTSFAITDPGTWCNFCNSWTQSIFCLAYNSSAWGGALSSPSHSSTGLSPNVAAVIGAVATLCFIGIVLVLAVGFLGLRFKRMTPNKSGGVESGLGGFKGGQKLASDLDVSVPKKGGGVAAVAADSSTTNHAGKERIGSWELKQTQASGRVSPVSVDARQHDGDMGAGNPFEARPVTPVERI